MKLTILFLVLIFSEYLHCRKPKEKPLNQKFKNRGKQRKDHWSVDKYLLNHAKNSSMPQRPSHYKPSSTRHEQNIFDTSHRFDYKCVQRKQCLFGSSETTQDVIDSMYRNCFCDELCTAYDDCCSDFVKSQGFVRKLDSNLVSCLSLNINFTSPSLYPQNHHINFEKLSIKLVKRCPRSYHDNFIRSQCYKNNDGFRRIPVNGKYSKILYQNYYCAVCNGDTEVIFWSVERKFTANLQSLSGIGYVDKLSSDTSEDFLKLEHVHGMPPRYCEKDLISKCADWWESASDYQRCLAPNSTSYIYAVLRDKLQVYRNVHCAACNGIASDLFDECPDKEGRSSSYTSNFAENYQNPSFRILIDINTEEGLIKKKYENGEEEILKKIPLKHCQVGSVFNPFQWTCKQIFCRKNYHLTKNGCQTLNGSAVEKISSKNNLSKAFPSISKSDDSRNEIIDDLTVVQTTVDPLVLTKLQRKIFYDIPLNCSEQRFYNGSQIQFLNNGSIRVVDSNVTYMLHHYQHRDAGVVVCYSEIAESRGTRDLKRNLSSSLSNNSTQVVINYFKFTSIQRFLLFLGIFVSLSALLVTLTCFVIFKSLRSNHVALCIIGLTISLIFVQFLLILVAVSNDETCIHKACFYIAVSLHFFLLSTFLWLSSLTYSSLKNYLRQKNNLLFKVNFIDLLFLLAYTFFLPAVLVCVVSFLDILQMDGYLTPLYALSGCWISNVNAVMAYFILPALILTFFNITFLIYAFINQCVLRLSKRNEEHSINDVVLSFKLNAIIVTTWIFSFVSAYTRISYFWFLFIFLSCLTGPVIFYYTIYVKNDISFLKKSQASGQVKRNTARNEDNMVVLTTDSFISKDESSEISNGVCHGRPSKDSTLESRKDKTDNELQRGFEQLFQNYSSPRYQAQTLYHHHHHHAAHSSHGDNLSLRNRQEISSELLRSMKGRYTMDKKYLKEMVLIETCM